MKNINLLATTILLILCFCTNVNASDDKTPLNPDESDECKDSLFSYTQEFIHQALTDSPEKAAEKLGVPISTIHDWTDKEIGEILKGIIKEEPTQEQIPIINLSYWAVMNQTKDDAMKLQDVHTTIEMTAEKLGVSGGLLFAWISNREIQSHFMYTIAQRRKEGTLSDWVHEYKDEIDKLQSPPQHTMSLLYRDGRYNAVTLALENGIEKTAQDLDIPHSILSVLVFKIHSKYRDKKKRIILPFTNSRKFCKRSYDNDK